MNSMSEPEGKNMKRFMYETKETEKWQLVYESLSDELSRKIYLARSLYSLTCDRDYLKDIIRDMPLGMAIRNAANERYNKKLALVGAGEWAEYILRFFPEIHWDYVADNYKAGKTFGGLDIITPGELYEKTAGSDVSVVISILDGYDELISQLVELGFPRESITSVGAVACKHQYFDLPALNLSDNEVFLDVGGLDGATSLRFSDITNGRYRHIYCFEPNRDSYKRCLKNTAGLHDFSLFSKGVSDKNGIVKMSGNGGGANILNPEEGDNIEVIRLDDVCDEATYIKMDIEGAEMNALLGAEQLIRRCRPKLAISVYHLRTDIWEIPKTVLSWHPDYRLFFRVYSLKGNDVVMYAL